MSFSHSPLAVSASASSSSSRPTSSNPSDPNRLFVGNLSPTVDEYTLIQVFSKAGKVAKMDYLFHKSGPLRGKPRGYAFVEFVNKADAERAVAKLHGRLFRGRNLVVSQASASQLQDSGNGRPFRKGYSDPTKSTTLSLLKSQGRPQSANAQIAALEAKLASMQNSPFKSLSSSEDNNHDLNPGSTGSSRGGSRGRDLPEGGVDGEDGEFERGLEELLAEVGGEERGDDGRREERREGESVGQAEGSNQSTASPAPVQASPPPPATQNKAPNLPSNPSTTHSHSQSVPPSAPVPPALKSIHPSLPSRPSQQTIEEARALQHQRDQQQQQSDRERDGGKGKGKGREEAAQGWSGRERGDSRRK